MPSSCLQKLLLSVAVAFLALPLHVTAEEVLRYVGKAEISTPVGYSCYPDMAGIVDVVLVLAQESRSSRGYLIFNPGLAVDIEREHGSEAWTIPALPIGESRTPFFLPRQIRITGTGGDLTLTVDWKPYADCVAATTTAALKLDPTPALAATDFARYERRDALTRSVRNAANGQASERKRAGTDLLDFLTSELGPVHPETIEAAVELTEQRNKAEPYDPEAMRTMARAITEHPAATRSVLRVQQAQCQAEADAGVWRDALTSCSKLVAAQAPVLHRLHEDVLEALFSLSHAHARTGDGVTALAAGKDAYLRTVERHGRNSAQAGNAAYTYFLRLFELGRGVEALDLAEQSYEIRLKHYGLNDTRTLEALNAIGVINSSHLARPEIALPIFFQVRDEALRNGVPKDLRQLATVTFNVANTQYRMRLFKEALESSREADRLSRAAFPATARQRYSPTQVQVRALAALGARDEALALARKSLGEAESNLPNDFYTVARAAQLLADQVSGHGSLESLEVWERAYRLGKQGIPRTDVQMIGLIRSYADELDRHGKHADAIEKRHELVESVEALVAQGSALGDARASAFKQWAESYRRLARNLLDEGRSENALEITERAKSRLLLESIALRGAADVVQMTLEERAQLSRLRDQLQRADLRLAASEASSRTIVEIERNRVARELDAHVKALRSRYPRFGKLTEIQPASSEAAQAVLPPRAVLVNFVVGERDLLLFAIARDRPLVAIRRELPPGLRESVNAYRLALLPPEQREGYELWLLGNGSFVASTRRPDAAASAVRDAQLIGHWLAQHLLNPIAAILRDHEHWIISPDSELAHLPFEALPWNGGRVVDQKQVSTTQSVSVYVLGRQSANVTRGSTGGLSSASRWLGLGAPDYAVLNLGLNAEAAAAPRVSGLRSVRQQATLRSEFAPLPNAREELQLVAKSFKQPTLIVGAAATEERLRQLDKSGDLSRFQILHLAAHGFVHPQQPSLSAVVLGADGTPGTDGDGFVTASEWIGLTLSSELIVLSACETALGPTVSGEGVLGLPYALFVAGNRNAVLTLWSVADHATSLFMRQFFTRVVKGHSAAGALSATKR
ncbi:MAG: CHAT domain-containing protein, partial [Burkholderiaceae bacterium]